MTRTHCPPRVEAALNFVESVNDRLGASRLHLRDPEDGMPERLNFSPMTHRERSCYDAACVMLTQYFQGEMDFGDAPMTPAAPDPLIQALCAGSERKPDAAG